MTIKNYIVFYILFIWSNLSLGLKQPQPFQWKGFPGLVPSLQYLVEGLGPHLVQVGLGAVVHVDDGAVLQGLPLRQVAVGLHGGPVPEVLLRLRGLAVAPLLLVQSLAATETHTHTQSHTHRCHTRAAHLLVSLSNTASQRLRYSKSGSKGTKYIYSNMLFKLQ